MSNDLTTVTGSLQEVIDRLETNLQAKGVNATYSASTGILGLVDSVATISQTGGGATNIVQGTFTTSSSGNTTGSVSLNYTGSGYPIMALVYVANGVYNNGTGGDSSWYSSVNRYDVGLVLISKSRANVTPTYATSGEANYGVISYIYKNSTSNSTTYAWSGTMNSNSYTSSSTNASANNSMLRFKGDGKTLSYYIGNRGSSTRGLARSTTYAYIVVYSS